MTAALAPASCPPQALLDSLTSPQREDLLAVLADREADVVAYGLLDGFLAIVVGVEDPGQLQDVWAVPWQVQQRFWHGFADSRRVGLTQASRCVEQIRAAGGVLLRELPPTPEGWYGWR